MHLNLNTICLESILNYFRLNEEEKHKVIHGQGDNFAREKFEREKLSGKY